MESRRTQLIMNKEEGREFIKTLVERFSKQRKDLIRTGPHYNETKLRTDFLNEFLVALGWDVFNKNEAPQHLRDVVHEDTVEIENEDEDVQGPSKKPDYALRIGGVRKLFVEAKKPSVRVNKDKKAAFQTRRYGWNARMAISVLTNFDNLVIYDCRPRPKADDDVRVARLSIYNYTEYVTKFDEVYDQISSESVRSGKFDEIFGTTEEHTGTETFDQYFLEQIEGWRRALASDLSHNNTGISEDELNFLIQRLINRILFLRICEDRTLEKYKALKDIKTYDDLKKVFRKADKRYNSGLFDFIEDELSLTIIVGSDVLISIFKELYYPESPYDFSVVETSLLGEIYELFLAHTVWLGNGEIKIVEKPEVKEVGGVVPTPRYIVNSIIQRTLKPLCEGKTPDEISKLRIADIACGSGIFLVTAYEYLQQYHADWYLSNGPEKYVEKIYQTGNNEWRITLEEKRRILLNNIYGVDIDIQAVEVSQFSLLLKVLEDTLASEVEAYVRMHRTQALPKLDKNIRWGNSLVDSSYFKGEESDTDEVNEEQLTKINPFDWSDSFPSIVGESGFDLIVGNPPYIRIQNMVKYSPKEVKFYQSKDSPYMTAKSDNFDKYNLFIERSLSLLKPKGYLGYIVPNKFFTVRAGKALRSLISKGRNLAEVVHFGVQQVFGKRVTTYVCILKLSKKGLRQFTVEQVTDLGKWRYGQPGAITAHDASEIGPESWSFASDRVKMVFERIKAATVERLDDIADIFVGLQTSADKVYIIRPKTEDKKVVTFEVRGGRSYTVEREILRPCLYKVHFSDFYPPEANTYIIFPYKVEDDKAELYTIEEMEERFPRCFEYLRDYKKVLDSRSSVQGRTAHTWYRFGRSQSLTKFNGEPKLIWSTLLSEPRYVYDEKDIVFTGGGNGPYYGLRMKDESALSLFYVQAILHHPVIDEMVRQMASQFRGGYASHGKQFVADLPIRTVDFNNSQEAHLYKKIVRQTESLNVIAVDVANATVPHKRKLLTRRVESLKRELFESINELYGITDSDLEVFSEINE
jgi:type I restriction-modification system DNA methylase subunit